jgi:hypothetical protein
MPTNNLFMLYIADLVVGSPDSDKVVYLRTRPIIKPRVTLIVPKNIDIDDKQCIGQDKQKYSW